MIERILALISDNGITEYKLEKEAGLSFGTIYTWRKGKSKPSTEAIVKIAKYFHVTTDYLTGLSDIPHEKTGEMENVVLFREIGTVKAGYDGSIDEVPTGRTVMIPASEFRGAESDDFRADYFVLRVSGNSMYPKLLDGDNVLCRRTSSVDSGDYAIVLYNGDEATVKKVQYKTGEPWMNLVPENPEYMTKHIEGADLQYCRILGKVVSLIRRF